MASGNERISPHELQPLQPKDYKRVAQSVGNISLRLYRKDVLDAPFEKTPAQEEKWKEVIAKYQESLGKGYLSPTNNLIDLVASRYSERLADLKEKFGVDIATFNADLDFNKLKQRAEFFFLGSWIVGYAHSVEQQEGLGAEIFAEQAVALDTKRFYRMGYLYRPREPEIGAKSFNFEADHKRFTKLAGQLGFNDNLF